MRAVRLWRQQQRQLLQMCTTSLGTPSEIPLYIAADRIRHVLPLCDSCHTSTLESFSRTTRVTGCLNVKDARQYATSAKFSEGAFVDDNTRGSSTKDLDDQEPDDKQMLLESALSFVVSTC